MILARFWRVGEEKFGTIITGEVFIAEGNVLSD